MYDTLNFWLPRSEIGNFSLSDVGDKLTNAKEMADRETGEMWMYGDVDNLRVTASIAGVSVKGSLARFFLPDNTYTLTRNLVKSAVEKLSETVGLPLDRANITRMDVSTNFIMKHSAGQYFEVLGGVTNFKRSLIGRETLYYFNRGRVLTKAMAFYDKARETANSGKDLPEVFRDSNLLRYESRWMSRLPQQLKEPEIKGGTLWDRRFYGKIVSLWADNYFKIEKINSLDMEDLEKIKTVSDAFNYLCAMGLKKLGQDEVAAIVEAMKDRKVFSDPKYYTRLKERLKGVTSDIKFADTDELVKELDSEVRQVLAYKR